MKPGAGSGEQRLVRLGAVSYLNTKPLVLGLEQRPDLFTVRYDVPARCAELLHEGGIDLGLIPAIEYLRGDEEYRVVPGVAIGSHGPIASVALFTRVPIGEVRTLALDVSSRTSAALTRILCAERWQISPAFTPAEPDARRTLSRADAVLIIGDPALAIDPEVLRVTKLDLGSEWKALTGLPFVYAMWCGRDGAVERAHLDELNAARDRGVAAIEAIAREEGRGDAAMEARSLRYLRDNLKYGLGEAEIAGLRRFHELAVELNLAAATRPVRFYEQGPASD
jgi:chorismate dehydratase